MKIRYMKKKLSRVPQRLDIVFVESIDRKVIETFRSWLDQIQRSSSEATAIPHKDLK